MAAPIEFYFDFSSPFGYFASEKIDALAAGYGRETLWRPFLLGAVYKITGGTAPINVPVKAEYYRRDFLRSARLLGLAYRHPSVFPIGTVSAARAFYWLDSQDPARAKILAHALYRAYFVDDIDISSTDRVIKACAQCGIDAESARRGIDDAAVKNRTRLEVERCIAKGVFGSPFIIVDEEPFWGADRLDQVEKWLVTGGW